MKKGVDGVESVLYLVPETLSSEVMEQMKAPPKDAAIPGIRRRSWSRLTDEGVFDSTGQLRKQQKLAGKLAGFFVRTGKQGGGQETTAWTTITQLAHHGMLFVPIGYTFVLVCLR